MVNCSNGKSTVDENTEPDLSVTESKHSFGTVNHPQTPYPS